MIETLKPRSADEVVEAVQWAVNSNSPVELIGAGTKRGLGHPVRKPRGERLLDLSALSGVTSYQPEELVVTVLPGTPVSELHALLDKMEQQLGFEPPDFGPLYGNPENCGTIGGLIGCNHSGPRRFRSGAARDHVLGLSCVSGRGEEFKCGGRVVKNVTGYDLCKLLTGSFGTLAAFTELTLRVVPRPEQTATILLQGLGDSGGIRAMSSALESQAEVSAAAHLPQNMTSEFWVLDGMADTAVTALRLEGPAPSVEYRIAALGRLLGSDTVTYTVLEERGSREFWAMVRDAAPFARDQGETLWRISVAPANGARVVGEIIKSVKARWFYDWGGGLIWLSVGENTVDGGALAVRQAVTDVGGHATLVRASDDLKSGVPVFHPQETAVSALSAKIKQAFDPNNLLNPGRMAIEA